MSPAMRVSPPLGDVTSSPQTVKTPKSEGVPIGGQSGATRQKYLPGDRLIESCTTVSASVTVFEYTIDRGKVSERISK